MNIYIYIIIIIKVKKWWNSKDRWSKIKVTEENMKLLTEISNLFQTFDTDKSGTIDKSVNIIIYYNCFICIKLKQRVKQNEIIKKKYCQ